jgi:MinD-like ATPase involved in chromosome partitioning or flagellar assembly
MKIAIAVPEPHGERLSKEATRHGHNVVLTAAGTEALSAAFEVTRPELAIVVATPTALTAELLAHCDSRGIRLLAAITDDSGRRHAAEVGVLEMVLVESPWSDFEHGLLTRLRDPGPPVSAVPVSSLPVSTHEPAPAPVPVPVPVPVSEAGSEAVPESPARSGPINRFAPQGSHRAGLDGVVIVVWGAAGAPGRTMLAISVAAELASRGHSVALCDADTYSASIAPTLGILDEAPGFAAACRLAGNDSLTRGELERIGSRYGNAASGFWVLTGINSPRRWPELSGQRVQATIAECARWVDFTVVDTGFSIESDEEISSDLLAPRRNAATIAALGVADQVLAVGAADPVGLSRFLRGYSDVVEIAGTDHITVVMNKLRSSAIGLNPVGQVQQTLARFGGINDAVIIPADHVAMDSALLSGRTLREVAPKSPVRAAVAELVSTRILS